MNQKEIYVYCKSPSVLHIKSFHSLQLSSQDVTYWNKIGFHPIYHCVQTHLIGIKYIVFRLSVYL